MAQAHAVITKKKNLVTFFLFFGTLSKPLLRVLGNEGSRWKGKGESERRENPEVGGMLLYCCWAKRERERRRERRGTRPAIHITQFDI